MNDKCVYIYITRYVRQKYIYTLRGVITYVCSFFGNIHVDNQVSKTATSNTRENKKLLHTFNGCTKVYSSQSSVYHVLMLKQFLLGVSLSHCVKSNEVQLSGNIHFTT